MRCSPNTGVSPYAGRVNRLARLGFPAVLAVVGLVTIAVIHGILDLSHTVTSDQFLAMQGWITASLRFLTAVCLAVVLGALVVCSFIVSEAWPGYNRVLDSAAASGSVLVVVAGCGALIDGVTASDESLWLLIVPVAAAVSLLCFLVRRQNHVFWLLFPALFLVILVALQSSGGLGVPGTTQMDLVVHLLAATVWLGTLLVCALPVRFSSHDADHPAGLAATRRYVNVASACFAVVAISGLALSTPTANLSASSLGPWCVLVALKAFAVLLLAFCIFRWRSSRLSGRSRGAFATVVFVVAEVSLMAVAFGISAVLPSLLGSYSAPLSHSGSSPAQILTGSALPPTPSFATILLAGTVHSLWFLVCVGGVLAYLLGVRRLRQRNQPWAISRTTFWVLGLVVLFVLTSGGLSRYITVLFSARVSVLLLAALIVPLLLGAGRPLQLAAHTVRARTDGSRGIREWWGLFRASTCGSCVLSPLVAVFLLLSSLAAFLVGPFLRVSVTSGLIREWTLVQLVLVGCLSVYALRSGRRPRALGVTLALLGCAALVFAALGVFLWLYQGLLVADWFGSLGRTWGLPPLVDQQHSALIVWILGALWVGAQTVGVVRTRLRARVVWGNRTAVVGKK